MTDHESSQHNHPRAYLLGDLAEQLDALRAEVDALKADFVAAKREGALQVADVRDLISDAREYTEALNQRRVGNIDDLMATIERFKDDIWALQVSLERKIGDVERQSRRV